MGQLYNRQPRKAFALALITYVLDFLMVKTRLLFTFSTMVVTILALGLWKLFVAAEAGYAAAAKKPESAVPMPRLTYPFLAIIFFVAVFIPFPDLKSEAGFASFKVPSASMCPTICLGERFVADMHAYKLRPPQRGDLILMKHSSSDALFIKRVIAIAGDTVAPGPGGTILVKGQRFSSPAPCGTSVLPKQNPDPTGYPAFQSTSVPEGSFFVVGDNIANSYDSRIPEFGPVTQEMVRGKPLFLYWSTSYSRIGCSIR
jgi:signal peptidase I